jgi:hypothetical protein
MKKSILFLSLLLLLSPLKAKLSDDFNPALIISDYDLLDHGSMSLSEIQNFLEEKNSYLANYKTKSSYGQEKLASEIIYDAAVNNYDCSDATLSDEPDEEERKIKCQAIETINPKFLLVLLQKEQSLISAKTPKESQLDWAMGYGCPDSWVCNPYFRGFGKQVNSAALQFRWYMLNPNSYNFRAGNSYTFENKYSSTKNEEIEVTIKNQATAALYNYTPHVYDGNYNFWRIWHEYFPAQKYPEETILKVDDYYWLIQDGKRRKFSSIGVLNSRYNSKQAVIVDESVLSSYQEGPPIRFHNYAIIMSPKGELYLLVDEKKRPFASTEAFRHIGYNMEEIMNASWQDVNSYTTGKEITMATAYPTGALLQNKETGGVYWVENGTKAPIIDKIFLETKYKDQKIISVDPEELDSFTRTNVIRFKDGSLLKSNISPTVYLIDAGKRRAFLSGEKFEELGYQWSSIITVPETILTLYSSGDNIE